ncbi:calcium-binding protein [Marinovum sp. 2_MG-2023]|uniref:calcium-binding protein n=1 Tax=unclassified Marinovum TaxID=2647166 RepID=UPI0026E1DD0B|nr:MULTISPECIES: calcium-binding protein [unclassified Marinovum]MDO6729999.1 calcium-binding protein [Marinovum sp. 2_MG-2023]MDO6779813.1 calcium-binding protein [Marinovum sp. 1_MG-2023]
MELLLLAGLLLGLPFVFGGLGADGSGDDDQPLQTPDESDDDDIVTPDGGEDPLFARITGTDDFDILDGGARDDSIRALDGDDVVFGGPGSDSIYGGPGHDLLGGDLGDDLVVGGLGEDTVEGWTGDDTVLGGYGNDLVYGDDGDDIVDGGAGNDYVGGGEGLDTLLGGSGNDTLDDHDHFLDPGPATSVMDGGDGDDTLMFLAGSTVSGGDGADDFRMYRTPERDEVTEITDFDPAEDQLWIDIQVREGEGGDLTLRDWEDGTGADLYYGDALVAHIGGGQDLAAEDIELQVQLWRNGGEQTLEDGDGDTTLYGNYEDDTILGGGGDDYIVVGGASLGGSNYQAGENLADGGEGDDTIFGSGGEVHGPYWYDDDSEPGVFEQTIGRDTLIGGAGDDLLVSENGNEMTGGAGADIFAVDHEIPEVAQGFDFAPSTITDFDAAEDELVVIINPNIYSNIYTGARAVTVDVWEDGTGADVALDGTVIAEVAGGQNLTTENIRIEQFGVELAAE